MAVLCGNHAEVCFSKYGSLPLHDKYMHEMGLRIVLSSIQSHAGRYKRYIVPVLALSIDFYVRIFVRVFTSASEIKKTATKLSTVYQCVGCDSFHLQPLGKISTTKKNGTKFHASTLGLDNTKCTDCGKNLRIGGPIWSEPMHDSEWISEVLNHMQQNPTMYNQSKKLFGLLSVARDEIPTAPLYYTYEGLVNTLHLTPAPSVSIRSALLHQGYKVSGSHANPNAIKTDAPSSAVWDVMRAWAKLHPSKRQGDFPGKAILAKEPSFVANFTEHPQANISREVPRFIPNPRPNWGPKPRAGGGKKRSSGKVVIQQNSKKTKTEQDEST
eukprot:TRINITY_DN5959_c0_g1_i2.p3 TRINITY_DN5959_c0_g1~~TRINITY_DN5959_c0_g1_i2.p3  ORF type:complete len:327 (-),score=80.18 TRINITY_DN5959_c0_g1_i2:1106-2086(-)